jgi:hypothetical protein
MKTKREEELEKIIEILLGEIKNCPPGIICAGDMLNDPFPCEKLRNGKVVGLKKNGIKDCWLRWAANEGLQIKK